VPYAFPVDLAEQVAARWSTFLSRHDSPAPPLPSIANLRHILETAFFASLAREEGRVLRFVLCCTPSTTVHRDGSMELIPVVPLRSPRSLTVESIRSIAPAVSPANAAIVVRFAEGGQSDTGCEIAGILNVGSDLARARSGRSFYHRPAPYALVIEVRDAGEMHVYRSGIKLASVKTGRLQDQLAFSGVEFLPLSDILTSGIEALRQRIRPPAHESSRETSDFEWTALLNTVLSIVNGVNEHAHGGTLLLVAPGSERTLPVRMKFGVEEPSSHLADRYLEFLNTRHELTSARLAGVRPGAKARPEYKMSHLLSATFVAEEDLADAADLAARLSAVDGALVITSDLRILGFGAEIVLDAARPVTAFEDRGGPRQTGRWPVVDSESFGMRHRSALRCVAVAEHTASFVASQDGTVSVFWKHDGRVLLKRHVNTANPNMIGA
jgi:hypothetical protein